MKKRPIIPIAAFLVFFLALLLLREINITGKSTSNVYASNHRPILTTDPAINFAGPSTNIIIECLPGLYYDMDNNLKIKDYYRWYRNNMAVAEISKFLDLSIKGNGDEGDELRCSQTSNDGFANSTWRNSSAVHVISTTVLPSKKGNTEIPILEEQQPAVQEDQTSSRNYTPITIAFVVILALLVFITAWFFFRKKKKPKSSVKPKSGKEALKKYIKQAFDRGYNVEEIETNLIKAGWPPDMIREALEEI